MGDDNVRDALLAARDYARATEAGALVERLDRVLEALSSPGPVGEVVAGWKLVRDAAVDFVSRADWLPDKAHIVFAIDGSLTSPLRGEHLKALAASPSPAPTPASPPDAGEYDGLVKRLGKISKLVGAVSADTAVEAADAIQSLQGRVRELTADASAYLTRYTAAMDNAAKMIRDERALREAAEAALASERERALDDAITVNNEARTALIHSGQVEFIDGVRAGHDRAEEAIRALSKKEKGDAE